MYQEYRTSELKQRQKNETLQFKEIMWLSCKLISTYYSYIKNKSNLFVNQQVRCIFMYFVVVSDQELSFPDIQS